jgi:hypothetical protein
MLGVQTLQKFDRRCLLALINQHGYLLGLAGILPPV